MRITEARLRQIVLEEVRLRLLEQLIEEELKNMGLHEDEIDDAYQAAKRKARNKKIKDAALATLIGGGAIAGIGDQYRDASKAKSQVRAADQAEKAVKAQSMAVKRGELIDYINNPAAFRWGHGGETMMQARAKEGTEAPLCYLPVIR